jgi:uncharacterized membrane protein YbhN (UPF0104 family)
VSKVAKRIVRIFLFFIVSVVLFWLVFRDQDWQEMGNVLKKEVHYGWIWAAVVLGLASHVARSLRWVLLAGSMGYRISFWNSFMGVMTGYLSNIALPRMGEFTRCAIVSKYEKVPFANLLGTVVTERIIDLLLMLLMTLLALVTQFKQIVLFLGRNGEIGEKVSGFLHSGWVWVVSGALLLSGYAGWKLLRKSAFYERIRGFASGLKAGLLSVRDVRQKGRFIFYSLFIWGMFYLSFYVCFFCFEFTSHLGPLAGLAVFVISSYGMIAPVQGGIGAWHFMVIAGLAIYLPAADYREMSGIFAILTHAVMTLSYIVVGGICFLALPLYNARRHRKRREAGNAECCS